MITNMYCLGLTCSAVLFAIGSIAMISSYFNYLYISSEYKASICVINNTRTVFISSNSIYQGQIYLIGEYNHVILSEWILVSVGNNVTVIQSDLIANYPVGISIVCYISKNDIMLNLYIEYVVLISAGIIMCIAMLITLILAVIKCVQNSRHAGYMDLDRKNTSQRNEKIDRGGTDMDSLSGGLTNRTNSYNTGV